MKNLKSLVLSLVLFLGSCATVIEEPAAIDPTGFLGKVLDKSIYMDSIHTDKKGFFNEDGKTFTIFCEKAPVFIFIKSSGLNSAIYETTITEKDGTTTTQTITIYTTDGMSGTLNNDDDELQVIWLKATNPEFDADGTEKQLFLVNILGTTIYTDAITQNETTKFGSFSSDGLKFTGTTSSAVPVVTFLRMTATGIAEFKDRENNVYTFTTTDGAVGSVGINGTLTPIWVTPFGTDNIEEKEFLAYVIDKTIYNNKDTQNIATAFGTFSSDGLTFTGTLSREVPIITFLRMIAVGTAVFIDTENNIFTFSTIDGKTGSATIGKDEIQMWLTLFDIGAEKLVFAEYIGNKTIYNNKDTQTATTALGTFSTDGSKFTGVGGAFILTLSTMTTVGTAIFTDTANKIYTFSTADGLIGSANITGTPIPLWLTPFNSEAEKLIFEKNLLGKFAYSDEAHEIYFGSFSKSLQNDKITVFISSGGSVFSLSTMITVGTAVFIKDKDIYTFSTTDGKIGFVDIGNSTLTPIYFNLTPPAE